MKYLIIIFCLINMAEATTYSLKAGKAKYEVSYLTKTVYAESSSVKGKVVCEEECEFLLAIPLKTFDSGDSNRDLNMQTTVEAGSYPIVTAKGKFEKKFWGSKDFTINALVNFHGVDVSYPVKVTKNGNEALLVVDLDRHKIERPSLFAVKINKEVPITFKFEWTE